MNSFHFVDDWCFSHGELEKKIPLLITKQINSYRFDRAQANEYSVARVGKSGKLLCENEKRRERTLPKPLFHVVQFTIFKDRMRPNFTFISRYDETNWCFNFLHIHFLNHIHWLETLYLPIQSKEYEMNTFVVKISY